MYPLQYYWIQFDTIWKADFSFPESGFAHFLSAALVS